SHPGPLHVQHLGDRPHAACRRRGDAAQSNRDVRVACSPRTDRPGGQRDSSDRRAARHGFRWRPRLLRRPLQGRHQRPRSRDWRGAQPASRRLRSRPWRAVRSPPDAARPLRHLPRDRRGRRVRARRRRSAVEEHHSQARRALRADRGSPHQDGCAGRRACARPGRAQPTSARDRLDPGAQVDRRQHPAAARRMAPGQIGRLRTPTMRLTLVCAALLLTLPVAARAQDAHAGHAVEAMQPPPASPAPKNPKLPAAEDQAKTALNRSPRHGEYIDVPVTGGTPVRTWIVYPERKDKAPVVIVIHEIFGLSDWIRGVADQLASEGFIAVAPDLITGKGPNGGGTDSVATRDDVVKLVRELTPAEVDTRLNAIRSWATALPAANGKSASVGFCWGGGTSLRYAMQTRLKAAVVYSGSV